MNLSLRRATLKDIKTLQRLNNEVFIDNYKYDHDLLLDWALGKSGRKYFTHFVNDSNSFCCIASVAGNPVGYILCILKKFSYRKNKYLEIDNMGVIPGYRSKGIGTVLLNSARSWAKKNGYQKIYVNSYCKNTRAITFYKRHGLKEIDVSLEGKI